MATPRSACASSAPVTAPSPRARASSSLLGYSHTITVNPPEGITLEADRTPTTWSSKGTDKQVVGQVAANIRKLRAPEPYKGKGIKYADERILRKAGKAGK